MTLSEAQSKLHRCPFCWGNDIYVSAKGSTYYYDGSAFFLGYVKCRTCKAEIERVVKTNFDDLYDELIKAWNTRKGELNVTMEEKYGRNKDA